jgi:hypothetical protein
VKLSQALGYIRTCSMYVVSINIICKSVISRSQWPHGIRLGLRFRIPLGAWVSVACEGCVLLGRGLCDGPITHPEESYWVWCVLSVIEEPHRGGLGLLGLSPHGGGDNFWWWYWNWCYITAVWKSRIIHFVVHSNPPAIIYRILSYVNQAKNSIYEFSYVIYNCVPEDWLMIQLCTIRRSCGGSQWLCSLKT